MKIMVLIKREQVSEYLEKLDQNERKILRNIGVKFGRYHIFLYKLIKPDAVQLRILIMEKLSSKNISI